MIIIQIITSNEHAWFYVKAKSRRSTLLPCCQRSLSQTRKRAISLLKCRYFVLESENVRFTFFFFLINEKLAVRFDFLSLSDFAKGSNKTRSFWDSCFLPQFQYRPLEKTWVKPLLTSQTFSDILPSRPCDKLYVLFHPCPRFYIHISCLIMGRILYSLSFSIRLIKCTASWRFTYQL